MLLKLITTDHNTAALLRIVLRSPLLAAQATTSVTAGRSLVSCQRTI